MIKLTGKWRKTGRQDKRKDQNTYITQIIRRLVMGLDCGDPTGVGKLRTTDMQGLVQLYNMYIWFDPTRYLFVWPSVRLEINRFFSVVMLV